MTPYSRVPEYSVAVKQVKIDPLAETSIKASPRSLDQVAAELRLLSVEVNTCMDSLSDIRTSLLLLQAGLVAL